jgi:hypothetical protein
MRFDHFAHVGCARDTQQVQVVIARIEHAKAQRVEIIIADLPLELFDLKQVLDGQHDHLLDFESVFMALE